MASGEERNSGQQRTGGPAAENAEEQREQPRGTHTVRNVQHYDLPPISKDCTTEISHPNVLEEVIEVPHIQCIERIEEVPHVRRVRKIVPVPRVHVTERMIEIPKHVKEQRIVEVPQLQVVDHVVEVPQYITQEKVIEVPRMMLQERIIPIPKRTIEEKIVEVPETDLERILRERVDYATPTYGVAPPKDYQQIDDATQVYGPDGRLIKKEQRGGPRPVDEVVVIPHVQHVYRNVIEPLYRHIPKPVEVPLTHYRPVPIERIIDRNVPIPVELEVIQEFLCPRLEAKYHEVPVPIPVTRIVEKPVPVDAMFNSVIMDAYMSGDEVPPTVSPCVQMCSGAPVRIPITKMTPIELQAAGVSSQPSLSQVRSFKSRGASMVGLRTERSRDFFTQERSIVRQGTRR